MRMSPLAPIDKASYYGAPSILRGAERKKWWPTLQQKQILEGMWVSGVRKQFEARVAQITAVLLKVFFIGLEIKVIVINVGDNNLK